LCNLSNLLVSNVSSSSPSTSNSSSNKVIKEDIEYIREDALALGLAPKPPTRARLWESHYVKTSNRSRSICNGSLTPVTCTHICNSCCLAPVTHKRGRPTPGLASTMPVTNVDFW
jgi:hypothetical protein